jgi:hypothetical protein
MNKTLMIVLIFAALPFLLVWSAFILTGFSFYPRGVFQSEVFWGISIIYWLVYACMLGPMIEGLNEAFYKKPAK